MSSLEIEKLGQYRLLEVIGNGGMARVYRATQEGDHGFSKPVALKLLKPQLAADPESVDAFISEARLGSLLSHPNIVAVLNFGQLEQFYFLVMELMKGPTLFEVLTCHQRLQRRIPPVIVFQIIRQVCEGLGYAHQAVDRAGKPLNVIHRDLKPSNVLLGWHGVAKLGDFGVARAESNLLHTRVGGLAKGTAQYMAPEQAWGELELTPRTDLFALGLMLLHLLNLQHPYQAKSPVAMLRKAQEAQLQESIEALPEMSGRARVQEVLRQQLQADPARRFDSAETLALALEEVQSLQPAIRLVPWLQELHLLGLKPSAVVGLSSASENVSGKREGNLSGKSLAAAPESLHQTDITPALPIVTPAPDAPPASSSSVPPSVFTGSRTEEELPSQTLAIPTPKEKSPPPQPTQNGPTPPPAEPTMLVTRARGGAEVTPADLLSRKSAQESERTEILGAAQVAEMLGFALDELEDVTGAQEVTNRTLPIHAKSAQWQPTPHEEESLRMPLVDWPEESSLGLTSTSPALEQTAPGGPPLAQGWPAQAQPPAQARPPAQAKPSAQVKPAVMAPGHASAGPVFGGAAAQFLKLTPGPAKALPDAPAALGTASHRASASATQGTPQSSRPRAPAGALAGAMAGAPSKLLSPQVSSTTPYAQQAAIDQTSESDNRKWMAAIAVVLSLLVVAMVVTVPMLFPSTPRSSLSPAGQAPNPPGPLPTPTPAPSGTAGSAAQTAVPVETLYPSIAYPVIAPPGAPGPSRPPPTVTQKDPEPAPSAETKITPAPVIEAPSPVSQGDGFGYLTLNTVPPDHTVSVDEEAPRTVPVSRLKLSAGVSHQIQFYCNDIMAKQVSITLNTEERRTIVWDCEHGTFSRTH